MPRRVPVWQRGAVYYYTDVEGRRVSLKTKDRAEALRRYRAAMAVSKGEAERAEKHQSGDAQAPQKQAPPAPPPPPPPPAPPPPQQQQAPPATEPASGTGGAGYGNGAPRPDPLHQVGATAAAPPPAEDAGVPLSDEEVEAAAREMAETVVSMVGSLTAALAMRYHGRTGIVRQGTYERNVSNWMVVTRGWAREWRMGPWTAITLSTFEMARQQWTCEAGDVENGPAPTPGIPVHPTAAA